MMLDARNAEVRAMLGGKKKNETRLEVIWSAQLPDHVVDGAWSASGTTIAAAAINGQVWLFDAASGQRQFELACETKGDSTTSVAHRHGTAAIAFHPVDPLLATAGHDGTVRLWDLVMGQERVALEGGVAWVERVAWSPDGKWLAAAAGKKVRVWELASGELKHEFADHPATIADIAWKPISGSSTLAVAVYGGIDLYDIAANGRQHFAWKGSPLKLAWAPNGKMLAHGNQDASVHFWYTETGHDLQMSGYPTKIRELSWDFSSRTLATGGGEFVCLWDCGGKGPAGSKPKMLEAHKNRVSALAFQRRGFLLASGGLDGRVCVWQPANRTPLLAGLTFDHAEVTSLAWSNDDRMLLVGCNTGGIGMIRMK